MKILVIAPHADDEVLGCGGLLLRRFAEGHQMGWLLVTSMKPGASWSPAQVAEREAALQKVCGELGISSSHFYRLNRDPAQLERTPRGDLVMEISTVLERYQPDEVYLPHPGDAHSDHRVVFEASTAAAKWFRKPFIRRLLCYETLSETEASLSVEPGFHPDVFVDISGQLEKKISLMRNYSGEMGPFPFPRSAKAIQSLAFFRGAQAGFGAAEGFQLLRERI